LRVKIKIEEVSSYESLLVVRIVEFGVVKSISHWLLLINMQNCFLLYLKNWSKAYVHKNKTMKRAKELKMHVLSIIEIN